MIFGRLGQIKDESEKKHNAILFTQTYEEKFIDYKVLPYHSTTCTTHLRKSFPFCSMMSPVMSFGFSTSPERTGPMARMAHKPSSLHRAIALFYSWSNATRNICIAWHTSPAYCTEQFPYFIVGRMWTNC